MDKMTRSLNSVERCIKQIDDEFESLAQKLDMIDAQIREIDHMIISLQREKRRLEREYTNAAEVIQYGEPTPIMRKVYG